jgi:hypothetical protein
MPFAFATLFSLMAIIIRAAAEPPLRTLSHCRLGGDDNNTISRILTEHLERGWALDHSDLCYLIGAQRGHLILRQSNAVDYKEERNLIGGRANPDCNRPSSFLGCQGLLGYTGG